MTYNTTPITSGAAKFSTLDPDAPLFLEENNITVGANPENPATLYDYDTSTLTIGNIQTTNGELNIHNSDLIGVKRFVCQDFMGAIVATASDSNLQATVTLDNVAGLQRTKSFRVPSNFMTGSKIKLSAYCKCWTGEGATFTYNIQKYIAESDTYQTVGTISSVSGTIQWYMSGEVAVNAGDLLSIVTANTTSYPSHDLFYGASGIKIYYDYTYANSAIWDVID